ncbi:DinB family protein [Phytomonospora sp. NPDC050363]|uniref:DinB family protein n=1 Tax=Phytomonospora sp. NPDC050363 TaxID=3155642 RepID=UPI0033D73225
MSTPPDERPRGEMTGGESEVLTGFLEFQRETLAWKCAGLSDDQLRANAVASSTLSLLGLVRHATNVERGWFHEVLGGGEFSRALDLDNRGDADFDEVDTADVAGSMAAWRAERERSVATVAGLGLDATGRTPWGEECSLRWVLVHMTQEYARHNGHADLIREALDGVVGE